jgi:hypothetical protein
MRFFLLITFLLSFSTLHHAQSNRDCDPDATLEIDLPKGPKPYSSLNLNNNPCQFQFAIVTDRTGSHRPGIFMDGVRKLNLLQPEFVMSVGDLIEGYTEELDQLNREWDEFSGFIDSLEMPFFYVPGNHDITNQVMEDLWKEKFGPTYYHFVYKDVLFLCLNSEDQKRGAGRGTISDEQYQYIERTLKDNEDVQWTLVFMHQPLWVQEDTRRWPDVEKLLANRKHTVFVGHEHRYVQYKRNNGKYFILATTGGGSSLRGPELGEFDHVMWVTMTEQGPVMANLQLDGIWSEDVFTSDSRDFVERFRESEPLQIEPFFIEPGAAAEGKIRIRINNSEEVPMKVRFRNGFSWDLELALEEYEITVAPNTVEFVEGMITPRRWKRLSDYDPMAIKAEIWFEGEGIPNLKIPVSYNIGPLDKYKLPQRQQEIAIDGDLSEWDELPHAIKSDSAHTDLSATFGIQYDEKYLYVAAKVLDDDVKVDTGTVTFRQDYIGVLFSGDPLAESAMRTGQGWYENSYTYIVSPSTADTPSTSYYDDRLEADENPTWVCKATEQGYILEIAVPLTYVKKRQGQDWQSIRFNLIVQDWDTDEDNKPRFYFAPNWRSKDNVVGAGMFFRE